MYLCRERSCICVFRSGHVFVCLGSGHVFVCL